mgnify:CR=1 FL=1
MALEPKIKLCLAANCTGLTFYEETGDYNATTNPGGYGAPNPTLASVDHAELYIWPLYSLTNYVAPTYTITITPSDNPDLGTSILTDLNIQDGFWYFVYNLYDNTDQVIATVEQGYYYYCNTECCVSKLLAAIDLDSCMCAKEHLKDIEKYNYLKSSNNIYVEPKYEELFVHEIFGGKPEVNFPGIYSLIKEFMKL